jgi:hypothetical protein
MPRLIAYDPGRHLLIVELLPDAESLAERHARERTLPAQIGRMLGEALGIYHARAGSFAENESTHSLFARHVPVVLAWQRGGHAALGQHGGVGQEISSIVRRNPEFETSLDAIGADWRFDSLIHGDMKWDNVLVFPTPSGGLDFRIVDWEMADIGDADWDVGAILQSFLMVWIQSMPISSGLPPERYVARWPQSRSSPCDRCCKPSGRPMWRPAGLPKPNRAAHSSAVCGLPQRGWSGGHSNSGSTRDSSIRLASRCCK